VTHEPVFDPTAMEAADLNHPIVHVARTVVKKQIDGTYGVDDNGKALLAEVLVKNADDPTLAHGILGLFRFAALLHDDEKLRPAAAAIIETLGNTREKLPQLRKRALEQTASIDQLRDAAKKLRKVREKAIDPNAPAPKGSVKASSLEGFKNERSLTMRRV
jgi:hypothetical protein